MAEPLIDRIELGKWLRDANPDPADTEMVDFLDVVVQAAELVVRGAGSEAWAIASVPPVPPRAQLIATLLAKDYYLNPDGIIAESTGPISERKVEDVVRGMRLTDEEEDILAELAGLTPPNAAATGTLWLADISDGPASASADTVFVPAGEGSDWLFPMYATDDPVLQNWP